MQLCNAIVFAKSQSENMNLKKKKPSSASANKKRLSSTNHDGGGNKKRRPRELDEVIESSDEETEIRQKENYGEEIEETPAEKRKRLVDESLNKLREMYERDNEDELYLDEAKRDKEGERDSRIAKILQQEQLEESGRLRRALASRVQVSAGGFRLLVKHRQTVTGVALSEDASRGFSASKDGTIVHWDVENGKAEKYKWPKEEILNLKKPQGRATKHSKHVLALAVSCDGRYLASGGLDRHVHLWDVRTREHLQAFPGHQGPVSCLTFRKGTPELFSGSLDGAIKIWNVEDRTYIDTIFVEGKDDEILSIDSLRKERTLTVGRDHSLRLWKDPDSLRFDAGALSLECCCFISDDDFLSGSSDGSIERWSIKSGKPVHAENAHASRLSNGGIENSARSWVSSIAVCRNSDLAASGAGNGLVRLWEVKEQSKGIRSLFELPLVGFVNSLAFAKSAKFLIAGIGQEPRLGRWERIGNAQNGVAIHPFDLS